MSRKYEAIDLMKLYTLGSTNGWNEYLTRCLDNLNINDLAKTRYQIQAGMDDLAKQNLNTPEMVKWFCKWDKSLIDTANKIIRIKHPLPQDNPLIAKQHADTIAVKRKRDQEVQRFMQESSY